MSLREAMYQDSLSWTRTQLLNYSDRNNSVLQQNVWESLSRARALAVSEDDQLTAKAVWCLERIGQVQDQFVLSFNAICTSNFQEGWDGLEKCENQIRGLDRHFAEEENEFGIEHIRKHTKQFQELFPLKWGLSPGLLIKEARCSICDSKLGLRSRCAHKLGEIYSGEECIKVVTKCEFLHVALVENPVQKFTMFFPEEDKNHIFEKIQELATWVGSPWRRWSSRREERRTHHPAFQGIGRNQKCPCGSDRKFKKCCLNKEKVYPHFFIDLDP